MNYVIGDIHGERSKLSALLANIRATDGAATFVFIGDYLDKGEDPCGVLKDLSALSGESSCTFLRGNHEYYWERIQDDNDEYAAYVTKYGGLNTMSSAGKSSPLETKNYLLQEFPAVFGSLKNFYSAENFIATHSGIPPELYTAKPEDIAPEKFYFNRYDFILNRQLFQGKKVIFGHTGFYAPYYDGFKIGIDTAACYLPGQPLTAFCTDGDFFINSSNEITALSEIDQSCCPAIPRVRPWRQK
jgi:serine/threonine protein phosphatase 1